MKISRKLIFLLLAVGFILVFIIVAISTPHSYYTSDCLRKPTLSCVQIAFLYGRYDRAAKQYDALRSTEDKIKPLFDSLNDSVYQSLPLPEGAQEIEKSTILELHRRTLRIDYAFFETSLNDVLSVYNQFLLANDWKLIYKFEDDRNLVYGFNKETACLNIYFYESSAEYLIVIYYDYLKQDFSPIISPPLDEDFILWADFYESNGFAKCPDQH